MLFNAVAPVQSVRMVTDKFTGAPRGFCFAEFTTIADAAKILHTFNVRDPVSALGHLHVCLQTTTHEWGVCQPGNVPTLASELFAHVPCIRLLLQSFAEFDSIVPSCAALDLVGEHDLQSAEVCPCRNGIHSQYEAASAYLSELCHDWTHVGVFV